MYLISPYKKQYKANLHSHSTLSDGKRTPQELKQMYKSHGYSILSITDHEVPKDHSALNDEDFITITGYEAYIRNNPEAKSDRYEREIHLNLFARDPGNEAIVCYNPRYCKYITEEEKAAYQKVGSQKTRELTADYINFFVETAKEHGYIVAYNHPWWSLESEAEMLRYDGFFSMEMCNYGSHLSSLLEYNAALYDKLLCAGKRLACHSADDNHNAHPDDSHLCDSFGGFAMIMPESFTYDSILSAMEKGNMYSSMGPFFKEISMEGNRIHIECSDVSRIMVFTGSKFPKLLLAEPGKVLNCADFEIDKRAKFVRVSIADACGRFADTRGFFRDELDF